MLIPPARRSRLRSSTEPTMFGALVAGTTMVRPAWDPVQASGPASRAAWKYMSYV